MTELSFNQQKKLIDIATSTANKLADWSFLEEVKIDNEFMKHFEFMVREILIGVFHYKYGREVEIMSRSEEIKIAEAPTVDVNTAMLHASNKVGIKITLDTVVMFAALLKRKIKPEDCGKDVMRKIDSLVETFREVAEQEEEK
ncbi:MAG: hypothetical protein IJ366_00455 [Clostridia bacterium]|nr:hypothetical protein [Clostridia bacterium]MBQ7792970.1 hypothetical protein [Clostridia bacterium]